MAFDSFMSTRTSMLNGVQLCHYFYFSVPVFLLLIRVGFPFPVSAGPCAAYPDMLCMHQRRACMLAVRVGDVYSFSGDVPGQILDY